MSNAVLTETSNSWPISRPPRLGWLARLLVAVASILLIYATVLTVAWPFTKTAVIQALEQRSLRKVTIGNFRQTYFPPGCIAEDIRFLRIKHPEKPALLTIQKLVMKDGIPELLAFQRRLASVSVIGLHLLVPAKEPAGEPSPIMPLTYTDSKDPLKIGLISADGAVLDFESKLNGKPPLRLVMQKLSLYQVGGQTCIPYRLELRTFEPSGIVQASGTWGPWNPASPGSTPAQGDYTYREVNLASIAGSSGTLNSQGKFSGTLGRLLVNGKAEVENFRINGTTHSRLLNADFDAVVDTTKGDVVLDRVLASFNRTVLVLNGSVAGRGDETGKLWDLRLASNRARVEDILDLFITSDHPSMTGNVGLQGRLVLPPGEAPVVQRMSLTGSFGIDRSLFADKRMEQEMARLSVSAMKGDKEEDREDPQTVLSELKGEVASTNGVARLNHLGFFVPGAHATMQGTFDFRTYRTDLQGMLVTTGDLSDVSSGVKSLLLKALTPFLKRNKHARMLPFKIQGPYGNETVSLDLWQKQQK